MIYFTSDWHLGEDRIGVDDKPNLFYRPFASIKEQHKTIWKGIKKSGFKDGDILYHLGDVVYGDLTSDVIEFFNAFNKKYPNSRRHLVLGNYDTEQKVRYLRRFFDSISDWSEIEISGIGRVFLDHYPQKCIERKQNINREPNPLSITGHIHGLWKVQKGMINVGVDAWHFRPVSEEQIRFCWNAMQNHYDENVFPY